MKPKTCPSGIHPISLKERARGLFKKHHYFCRSDLFFFLALLFLALSSSTRAAVPFRVVIDPGHGGADEGTVFNDGTRRIAEKDLTLKLAHKIARQLERRGFEVSLTREKDHEVPLPNRTAFANRLKAQVFISIHMNATSRTSAEGVETFILNNTTDASSRRLARLENSVISETPLESPEDMDVALILKDLRLDANLSESKRLACQVQRNLVISTSRTRHVPQAHRNRGVKQALFHVLLGADMPSILVEAGFLSNPYDRALLLSEKGQYFVSSAVANAVDQFRRSPMKRSALNSCKIN